ncbi:hypothetical protein MHU86_11759 [Fragilaria crotonensis]|nr:hypothetical protein MHU86_11759 [Fragilaria crotonensis]
MMSSFPDTLTSTKISAYPLRAPPRATLRAPIQRTHRDASPTFLRRDTPSVRQPTLTALPYAVQMYHQALGRRHQPPVLPRLTIAETLLQATLHDEVQHPVPIKLEDLPDEDNPEINTGINYYSDSNNLPSNDNSFAYPVSPPFHSHDDEGHFAMLCMEENKSFDDDQPNDLLSANEAQEEDLPSEYQPPARMLPSLFPDPPYRPDDNLSEIHLNPFRMFQEEDYNAPQSYPSQMLFYMMTKWPYSPPRLANLR